jgi:hypothetical protein
MRFSFPASVANAGFCILVFSERMQPSLWLQHLLWVQFLSGNLERIFYMNIYYIISHEFACPSI